jgi:hypothetical protein
LKPQSAWRHSSFKPTEGMYVKQAAMQYRQLQEPQPICDLAGDCCLACGVNQRLLTTARSAH